MLFVNGLNGAVLVIVLLDVPPLTILTPLLPFDEGEDTVYCGVFVFCTGCVIGFVPELLTELELDDEGGLYVGVVYNCCIVLEPLLELLPELDGAVAVTGCVTGFVKFNVVPDGVVTELIVP